MLPELSELSDAEINWIRQQQAIANTFVAEFSPADVGQPLTLASLDRAYSTWFACEGQDQQAILKEVENVRASYQAEEPARKPWWNLW